MKIYISIYRLLNSQERLKLIFLTFISLVATILETMSLGLLIPLFTNLFNSSNQISSVFYFIDFSNFENKFNSIFNLQSLLIIIIAIYIFKNIFLTFVIFWSNKFTSEISMRLSYKLFKEYLLRSYLYHKTTNSSNLIRNVSQEVPHIQLTIMSLVHILLELLLVIFIFIMLFSINAFVTIMITVFSILIIIFYWFILKKYIENLGKIRLDSNGLLIKSVMQSFGAIKEIKLSSTENKFLKIFDKENILSKKSYYYYIFFKSLPKYFYEILGILILLSIFYFLYNKSLSKEYIITLLSIYAVSLVRILPSINRLSSEFLNIKFRLPSLSLIISELTYNKDKVDINNNSKNKSTLDFKIEKITFDKVYFKYKENLNSILHNYSLQINKNEFIGIYGKSGRGKTTLVNILSGLIQPTSGDLKVNNQSIFKNHSLLKNYQSKIGYVSQNTFILDGTLEDNITLNSNKNSINKSRLEEVIKSCQIHDLHSQNIENLGELGSKLSGGQIQRVGIARSLYTNPDILIFDEPTSSLDIETENKIINLINSFKFKKIIVLISHKKELLSKCDKVINLND